MLTKKIKILVILPILLFLIGIISAEGCCFDSSSGLCSLNSESASCLTNGGEFFSSPSCSESVCDKGCCMLGVNTEFVTSRTCELNSRVYGFEFNWQLMDESSCMASRQGGEEGACLLGGDYEKNCKITTLDKCSSGNFKPGLSCTDSSLNTICTETSKTYCYEESVWSQDSCGNPDKKIQECNYGSGFICTKRNVNEAYCKSLNCEGKVNGDSWCVDLLGEGNLAGESFVGEEEGWGNRPPVGSREFVQRCVNGKIENEPCADFRNELCSSSEEGSGAECIENDWAGCMAANQENKEGFPSVDESACGKGCKIIDPSESYEGKDAEMIKDLHLELCVPETKGGQEFWTETADESICSLGTYEAKIIFYREEWPGADHFLLKTKDGGNGFGLAGLLNRTAEHWSNEKDGSDELYLNDRKKESGVYAGEEGGSIMGLGKKSYAELIFAGKIKTIPLNGALIKQMKQRCKALGDCAAEFNWVGENIGSVDVWGDGLITIDPEEGIFEAECKIKNKETVECNFKLECVPWKAPEDGDCSLCGSDGLACSEYRCSAIGKNCEYVEDRDVCIESSDRQAPTINLISRNPGDPIPPYTPAEFVISTNEDSECKFNFDSAGNKYSEMKYNFGKEFTKQHKLIINLPGQTKVDESDVDQTAYTLMKQGSHTIYVRCLDAGGNGESMSPFLIRFEVMQDPDKIPPVIQTFEPVSGSAIKFNTTEKEIKFKINEPSECKWALDDRNYDLMSNSFSCDTEPSSQGTLEGYFCSGKLTNITKNLSQQTRFYIRCKDQPLLEGKEDGVYQRNTNDKSTSYILRSSEEFNITEVSPSGSILLSKNQNITAELKVFTIGGASHGKAICKWKLSNNTLFAGIGFTNFLTTNSSQHKQTLNLLQEGTYYGQIVCEDAAQNQVTTYFTFKLGIDRAPPVISKIYEKFGNLVIKTNENAVCYASDDSDAKCSFNIENVTKMAGSEKEHTTEWKFDTTYFIRCKDYYGNDNINNCNIIARTY